MDARSPSTSPGQPAGSILPAVEYSLCPSWSRSSSGSRDRYAASSAAPSFGAARSCAAVQSHGTTPEDSISMPIR
jgi:hypothetical protein